MEKPCENSENVQHIGSKKIYGQIKLKVTTESKGPRTKMLLVYVGAGDSSNQPKIKIQRQFFIRLDF